MKTSLSSCYNKCNEATVLMLLSAPSRLPSSAAHAILTMHFDMRWFAAISAHQHINASMIAWCERICTTSINWPQMSPTCVTFSRILHLPLKFFSRRKHITRKPNENVFAPPHSSWKLSRRGIDPLRLIPVCISLHRVRLDKVTERAVHQLHYVWKASNRPAVYYIMQLSYGSVMTFCFSYPIYK
jgi:hypothetical protein